MYNEIGIRSRRTTDWRQMVRLAAGAVVLAVGIAVALWVAITLYGLIWSEAVPAAVAHLTPQSREDVAVIFPGGEVVLAYKVFPVIGYAVTVVLMMLGVWLTKVLLAGGSSLLRVDAPLPPGSVDEDPEVPAEETERVHTQRWGAI
jgi:hypothetical protein